MSNKIGDQKFTDAELKEYRRVWCSFDTDGDQHIDSKEIKQALQNLGMYKSDAQVTTLIKEVDKDKSGTVEWNEFLDMIMNIRAGNTGGGFAQVYSKQRDLIKMQTDTGATHSYAEEEMAAFAEHLNNCLGSDAELKVMLPIDPNTNDLCKKVRDGLLLSKFINIAVKDTIDERALNHRKGGKELSNFQMSENQNLCINAARGIGVKITNVGSAEMMNGERYPHIVLGLVWQLVKIHLLSQINLRNHPALARLLEPGEELADLLKLPPDQLLLRWFNYHLKRANHRKINNFGGDVKDSDAYTTLLNQIAPSTCSLEPLKTTDLTKRADQVLANARALNVKSFIKARDICAGNSKLNLIFTAAIFNQCPGLEPLSTEESKKIGMMEDDVGDSREERMFRMWINSLGIDDLYINNLFADCRDGMVLLKVFDKVEPGIVSWNKVDRDTKQIFKRIQNCNYAVVLGKQLKFSLVGIQGADIESARNPKLLLALVWQLMRYHTLKFLGEVQRKRFGNRPCTDEMIIGWANDSVQQGGQRKTVRISAYQDQALSDGIFFLDLLHSINAKVIDWDVVSDSKDEKDKINNARYAISVARKLGATIFCLPEDLVECKPKMVMTFIASCMALAPAGA